jgi:hypothetical protein
LNFDENKPAKSASSYLLAEKKYVTIVSESPEWIEINVDGKKKTVDKSELSNKITLFAFIDNEFYSIECNIHLPISA